jgi:4-diphosphocytidyl-2-C-methyl-D-erythritol kinase
MQAQSLQLTSPAKINLFLNILERRADGFHNLETLMTPLALTDTLTCEERATGFTVECDAPDVPTDDRNLVVKAAKKLAETFHVSKGARIRLQKQIPAGGGMGGGSGNAAVTLRALNQLWQLNAPMEKLHDIAAQIGSDVPFFLYDSPAFCKGRGEIVEPLRLGVELGVLLINPGFGIPTKWAYDALAQERAMGEGVKKVKVANPPTLPRSDAPPLHDFLAALRAHDSDGIQRGLINSLESPCLKKYPLLALLKDVLLRHGALGAMMSGSGSTVFGLTRNETDAAVLMERMRAEFGSTLWMRATKTVDAK